MDEANEPSSLIELLYDRSFATLKKLATIYEMHGHVDKAQEISALLKERENDEETRGAA